MTLQKAGDGSVDGDVFNALVDDLNASGGSQPGKGPYTFAFNSANLSTPRTLFAVAPNDLVVFVPRYISPFDDGEGGINDAQLYLMVGDTALKPVSANRLQIEADITPALHNGGDAYVQAADNTPIPFFPLGTYGSTMVASVINSADVTAWVADGNGDPITPTPTEGRIDLFFLVYSMSV